MKDDLADLLTTPCSRLCELTGIYTIILDFYDNEIETRYSQHAIAEFFILAQCHVTKCSTATDRRGEPGLGASVTLMGPVFGVSGVYSSLSFPVQSVMAPRHFSQCFSPFTAVLPPPRPPAPAPSLPLVLFSCLVDRGRQGDASTVPAGCPVCLLSVCMTKPLLP